MTKRLLLSSAIVALVSTSAGAQNAAAAQSAAAGFASIQGTVVDGLHEGLLVHARVRVENTNREAITNEVGGYRIDSIPAGVQRLIVIHPLLDTLGIGLATRPISFSAGETKAADLSVPSAEALVSLFCTPAQRALGPAALVGFVRDADTEGAAEGAKASLLYYESDPVGFKKTPHVREQPIGKDGHYHICGLPATMSGKLQIFRNGLQTGEVPVELGGTSGTLLLAMRSMSIASTSQVVAAAGAKDSAGKQVTIIGGKSRVTGRVLNKYGQPIAGARVELENTGAATKTREDGQFTLDSLPSGTQTLEVRQLGFSPTETPVELSQSSPQNVTVKMGEYVPVLTTVRVQAQRGLKDVGFEDRKRMGLGYYLDADQLKMRQTRQFSDMLRTVPGVRVQPGNNGGNVITSSRDANGGAGCVMFYVDGSPWQQISPGDLDTYVRPEEIAALEVYNGATTPPQFTQPGIVGCTTVVIWTARRVTRKKDQQP